MCTSGRYVVSDRTPAGRVVYVVGMGDHAQRIPIPTHTRTQSAMDSASHRRLTFPPSFRQNATATSFGESVILPNWKYQTAPGRTAGTVETNEVDFGGTP